MDPFAAFFTPQFLFFALAIFAVTFMVRTTVEYLWKGATASNAWGNLILPLLPVALGAVGGLISAMYPSPLGSDIFAREVFGLTAGLGSGLVYKMLKGYIKAKLPDAPVTTTSITTVPTTTAAPIITTVATIPATASTPVTTTVTATTTAPSTTATSISDTPTTTDTTQQVGMSSDVHPT